MTQMTSGYPFGLEVDAPAAQNRLSVLLRIFYIIPHMIVLYILGIVAAIIYFISWFAILFTGGYPSGMMNFMLNYLHWSTRANAYLYLLTGQYPPFSMGPDGAYPVRLAAMGQLEGRNRLTTFWPIRSILAIPHIIVLYILSIVAGIVLFISWIVALFTGSVPAGMHNFLAGVLRWNTRVNAYVLLLTDEYPPFSLS
ncbi:MAG: DUF4389 domain-containing protein [Dehalococcoidia bacterium]|nr:DUF4389 domain-containing protein [Dehalococcoidia bacterium]MCA9824164.1 DUF4389 domain-containing protein [Dehalococcoidia bacterium]MCA9854239.1 DUF4389 domain-containing protein [Dehalococcoidia bacterium]